MRCHWADNLGSQPNKHMRLHNLPNGVAMRILPALLFLVTCLSFVCSSPAAGCTITVLDFNELQIADSSNNHTIGASYAKAGFSLTTIQRSQNQFEDFNFPGTLSPIFVGSPT